MPSTQGTQSLRLNDGRQLGYVEVGDPAGRAVFYFPGSAASGLIAQTLQAAAAEAGVRLIAPDRPGLGDSDFVPGRTLLDWPAEVCALADALGLGRFAVLSESGGSPYAAVCAFKIPERLTAAAIVAGVCPLEAPGAWEGMSAANRSALRLFQVAPLAVLRLLYWPTALTLQHWPAVFGRQLTQAARSLPEADQAVYADAEVLKIVLAAFRAAFRQGARGPAWDMRLCARPWGFALGDIHLPLQLWHGEADQNAPVAMARLVQRAVPQCRATYYPGEGHVSVMRRHGGEILQALRAA